MKKTLLCLVAFMLSVTMVSAQEKFIDGRGLKSAVTNKMGSAPRNLVQGVKKAPVQSGVNKIALDNDEHLVGFYTTDDLDLSGYSSIGLTGYPGNLTAAVIFTPSELSKAVGGTITKIRFGLSTSVEVSRVFISPFDMSTGEISDPVSEQTITSTVSGWNDVILDTPVAVEEGKSYMIGYDYVQVSGQVDEAYPLLTDYKVNNNPSDYGFMIYGNLDQGLGWYTMGTTYGNLCIQAVVKGGKFTDDDLTLTSISTSSVFNKGGSNVTVNLGVKNNGNKVPSSYAIDIALDGNVVKTLNTPATLSGAIQTVSSEITLPANLSDGSHELTATVAQINGVKPTENVDDDVVSGTLLSYSEEMPHQKTLVEQFTSTSCTYCPLGYDMLNALTEIRDDIAWVAIHGNQSPYYPDEYTTEDGDILTSFEILGWPSASFNRCYIQDTQINSDGSLAVFISWNGQASQVASMFDEVIDTYASVPAFATVNIASTYDPSTRNVNIKVTGDAVKAFKELMGDDAVLSVYLTEDGLVSRQNNGGTWVNDYPHDHVFRCAATNVLGDPIKWNGDSYENELNVTLDRDWNADNMNIVAFISRPIKMEGEYYVSSLTDVYVTNTNVAKVGGTSTGISDTIVSSEDNATEVARYSLDGTRLSAPTKGINIVKMSDGTTRKVVVAE